MAHRPRTPAAVAAAPNLTALITSDIGDHQLAADMCWRQLGVFTDYAPLEGALAELAAEPIVNLARLAIREGDGDRAHAILDQVLTAAANLTTASIEGNHIDTEKLVHDAEACAAFRQRLWVAMLADGTRALTRAGRWTEAFQAVERHNGIGNRLLDGRQTAVIRHYVDGNLPAAITMLADSVVIEPWEQILAAYLEICCASASGTATAMSLNRLVEQHHLLDLSPEQHLFKVRLGLGILELALPLGVDTDLLAKDLAETTLHTADAYAARDLITFPHVMPQNSEHANALNALLDLAGLGLEPLPQLERQRLLIAADIGASRLRNLIGEAATG